MPLESNSLKQASQMVVFVAFVLLSCVAADSTFRFGFVTSSRGTTATMQEAKDGYKLYFDAINEESTSQGFLLSGKAAESGFVYRFDFMDYDDRGNKERHEKLVDRLIEKDQIHFLGGSHPSYAAAEMSRADASGILNYHCCVGPDVFYEADYKTVFGVSASNKEYTKDIIRNLHLEEVKGMVFVYQQNSIFPRTTCEAGLEEAEALGIMSISEDAHLVHKFNETPSDNFKEVAEKIQKQDVEAVIACVFPDAGKKLVDAFHDIEYPLKAFFLTTGPTKENWINDFDPPERANGLLSAAQWHHGVGYRDDFFKSALDYTEFFQDKYNDSMPTYVAAGASAVGLTLVEAIRTAFFRCNINATQGEVDRLLYNAADLVCEDEEEMTGYERILKSLRELDMDTFFGNVKFNHFRRNIGLDPVATQVFESVDGAGKKIREIEAVLPLGYATRLMHYPADNLYKETCVPGQFVGDDDFDPCEPCEQGHVSYRNNARHCDSCQLGEWTNKIGQSECVKCPPGTTTHSRGSTKQTDCVCMPGHFSITGEMGVACALCPEGAICEGGAASPVLREGFWTNHTYRAVVYPCDPTENCLGGENVECAQGYAGRLCAGCDEGYFSVIQKCYRCKSAALIVILCILLLVGWYVINVIVSRSVASLEMILGWAQLANIIGDVNLNWTNMVTRMFGVANILDFDVDILEPSCLLKWGFRENFITQLCLPFLMTLMGCSGYLGSAFAYIAHQRGWLKLDSRQREMLAFVVDVPESSEQLKEKWDATRATFLASVDITYVTIAKYCFDVFKCETIAGVSVLRVDPGVECDDNHAFLIVLASLGIMFYVIGYPVCICWKLYDLKCRCAFADPENLRTYGFVYKKFELDYYYTPAIIIVRKLLFVLVLVYMNNPAFQVGAIAIIINASLMIHVYTAPYVDTYLDVLFSFLLLALMFEAFGGLMFYSENLPYANRQILEWIVMVTLFVLIAVFLVIFVMEMKIKYHIRFIKSEHRKFARERMGSSARLMLRRFSRERTLKTAVSVASSIGSHEEDKTISFELLETFQPSFIYRCLKKQPDYVQRWDKLTELLKGFMSDQADTSYLSMSPAAKFWRKLVDRFPELVDFLAVADDDTREKFKDVATGLYRNFYLSNKVKALPLMDILNWRDYAPMAQWLAIAQRDDRKFVLEFIADLYRTDGKDEAAQTLETKLETGGADPHLHKTQIAGLSKKKKKKILDSLSTDIHPFQHSAAERELRTLTTVMTAASKFRSKSSRDVDAAAKALVAAKTEAKPSSSPDQLSDETEISTQQSTQTAKNPSVLNNQTSFQSDISSQSKKFVSFSLDPEASVNEASGSQQS